jgi:hypothetical protein
MDKIEGGGSFNICPDTGAVTRDPESTAPEGAVIEQPVAVPAANDAKPAPAIKIVKE